ncbi:MAG TPA: aconitate hydratase, partial [Candidatus Sumerlaeota bacterium]|nr:aconitate hydratase [Candidatus Sumerlaeota bacterium]
GVAAVFARSFARIHRSNLINCGIAPVMCDMGLIQSGDRVRLDLSELRKGWVRMHNLNSGTDIPARMDLTPREMDILLAGGALAHARASRQDA